MAAATLVATDGSSPLDPGATMLVDEQGALSGLLVVGDKRFDVEQRLEVAAPERRGGDGENRSGFARPG